MQSISLQHVITQHLPNKEDQICSTCIPHSDLSVFVSAGGHTEKRWAHKAILIRRKRSNSGWKNGFSPLSLTWPSLSDLQPLSAMVVHLGAEMLLLFAACLSAAELAGFSQNTGSRLEMVTP